MSRASSKDTRRRPISVRLSWISRPIVAAQAVAPLAADRQDLDRLAGVVELADAAPRLAQDRGVEAAARPRSEVATTIRWVSSLPVPAKQRRRPGLPAIRPASEAEHPLHALRHRAAPASACSWARRSREAATIFIAEVIFCVDWTLRMRTRRSLRLGIG